MLRISLKRRSMSPWVRVVWIRLLGVLLLFVAAPGSVEVVQELVSHATGIECCAEDGCDERTGQTCPRNCMHCHCCAHLNAPPSMTHLLPAAALACDQSFGGRRTDRHASGYRARPFRPPVS